MSIFGKKQKEEEKPRRLAPTESHILTDSCQLDVWKSQAEDGATRLVWCASRIDPDDESRSYRGMKIAQLFEMPLFLAKVAAAFSGVQELPEKLRGELYNLANDFAEVVKKRTMNGEEASEKSRVLQF